MKQRTKRDWKSLTPKQKVRQVWDYYKLPIFIIFIFIYMIGYGVYRQETVKDKIFFAGLVNVAPGPELLTQLHADFESTIVSTPQKEEMRLYEGLYLTDNTASEYFQYSYSSQMKILASIDSQQLDVVLLDQEAYDAFSQNGYLYDLNDLIAEYPELKTCTEHVLTENLVILESNAKDLAFDPTLEFHSITENHFNGLNLSQKGIISQASLSGTVYLGIIQNTPRKDLCARYIQYLLTN